jgi:hypothetical protein
MMRKATGLTVLAVLLAGVMPVAGEVDRDGRAELLRLAHRFEARAYEVLDEAARDRRFFAGRQNGSFEAIQELAYVSTYFCDQVRFERDPYRTAEDFEILAEAFSRAAWWVDRAPTGREVWKDFRKLEKTFQDMRLHFGYVRPGNGAARRHRVAKGRYEQVVRTRVIPRVQGRIDHRSGRGRTRVDVGLRFPRGQVRVIWR